MKSIIYKIFFTTLFLVIFTSCEEKEFIELNTDANTTVSLSIDNIVLSKDNATEEALTVSWTEPDFGFDAAPTYSILIDFSGGEFIEPQVIPMGNNLSKTFTVEELNGKLLSLGVDANTETAIDFKVCVKLSDYKDVYSEIGTLTATAYSSLLDLSTNWGIVGSATPGAWGNPDIPDLPMYTTNTPGVYVAYVTLRTGEIKFRLDNAWTTNYGSPDADGGSLEKDGPNISIEAGTYKLMVNTNDLTWSKEVYSWGIVGSGAPNGWDGPDVMLQYNPYANNWKAVATLADGKIKFRLNNDWGLNYGDSGADGTLEDGGDDISVTAGHYIVTFDLENLEYSLESTDVWGLVGSSTPNGWDGPDTKFIPDFGVNEGYYYINGIELIEGKIKVRQNDAWGLNYGDDGNDGTLEEGGTDIPIEVAGTYNIVINFASTPPTISIIAW
jgi:hypothetical protein